MVLPLLVFQSTSANAANITVNTTNDELNTDGDCSLREAIQAANLDIAIDACTAGSGIDTITVPAGIYTLSILGTGEDANATGDIDITSNLTVNGAGATSTFINGGAIDRVFEVGLGATAQINGVTIQNGSILSFGGGIFNRGTLTINESAIDDNETTGLNLSGGGGGIFSEGVLTLTKSTISNNTSQGRGGGIYNLDSTLNITNSTISTNTSLNGGGIFNRFGTVNVNFTTIANNIATDNGGGIWNFGGTTNLKNSILSANNATTAADNCAGAITSQGYNVSSDASCALGGTGDLNSTNPIIGPLAANGGPTQTHALLSGSPAIDLVPLISCNAATDQRGVTRPQGPACDSGSYETLLPQQCPGDIASYNIIQGTNGNNNLNGTPGRDLILGYGGNDKISGGANDDCLVGGPGNDLVIGGSGDDVLIGAEGNDYLKGDSGNDNLFGGSGNDALQGGSGNDNLLGGGGNDSLKGESGSDVLDGEAGTDSAVGGAGTDTCTAESESSCEI